MNNREWFDSVYQQLEDDKKARDLSYWESGRMGHRYFIKIKNCSARIESAEIEFWLSGDAFSFLITGEVLSKYDGTEQFEVCPTSIVTRDELILLVRVFCGVTLN